MGSWCKHRLSYFCIGSIQTIVKRNGEIWELFLKNNKQFRCKQPPALASPWDPRAAPYPRPVRLRVVRLHKEPVYLRLIRVSVVRLHKGPGYHHQARASAKQSVTKTQIIYSRKKKNVPRLPSMWLQYSVCVCVCVWWCAPLLTWVFVSVSSRPQVSPRRGHDWELHAGVHGVRPLGRLLDARPDDKAATASLEGEPREELLFTPTPIRTHTHTHRQLLRGHRAV